jgi:hypothetical protein
VRDRLVKSSAGPLPKLRLNVDYALILKEIAPGAWLLIGTPAVVGETELAGANGYLSTVKRAAATCDGGGR